MARDTGFSQRSSKFNGAQLVLLCSGLSQEVGKDTLTNLSALLSCHTQTTMSPQGLHSRLNERAATFLEAVFQELLHQSFTQDQNTFVRESPFARIRIMDATAFILPPIFRQHYKGSGGLRHTSGAKIQLEYDLLHGQMLQIYLGEERENDRTFSVTQSSEILAGDLCIRDLGYFDLAEYQRIDQMGGY